LDADPLLFKRSREGGQRLGRGATVKEALYLVKGDQIHVRSASLEEAGQLSAVGHIVIQPGQENVFKGDLPARLVKKIIRSRHDRLQPGVLVGRHNAVTQDVVGGVQRYCQMILLAEVGQASYFSRQADGRNGDVAGAYPQS